MKFTLLFTVFALHSFNASASPLNSSPTTPLEASLKCAAKDLAGAKVYDVTIDWGAVVQTQDGDVIIHEHVERPAHVIVSNAAASLIFETVFKDHAQSTRCGPLETESAALGSFATIAFESGNFCGQSDTVFLTVAPNTDGKSSYNLECHGAFTNL